VESCYQVTTSESRLRRLECGTICSSKAKVELSLYAIEHQAVKTYGGIEVYLLVFLNLAIDGGDCSTSSPTALLLRKGRVWKETAVS
jgi:hypothetical protein